MFYNNLKKICDKKGVKVTPIVLECGGNKGSLSGWKKGAIPNSDIVMKIAVRLNVTTDNLLFGESEESEIEKKIIEALRNVNDEGKEDVLDYAVMISEKQKYQKNTNVSKEA